MSPRKNVTNTGLTPSAGNIPLVPQSVRVYKACPNSQSVAPRLRALLEHVLYLLLHVFHLPLNISTTRLYQRLEH